MINEVDAPSAVMLIGFAVLIIFAALLHIVVVTLTMPSFKLDEVAFTVGVPTIIVERNVIVA